MFCKHRLLAVTSSAPDLSRSTEKGTEIPQFAAILRDKTNNVVEESEENSVESRKQKWLSASPGFLFSVRPHGPAPPLPQGEGLGGTVARQPLPPPQGEGQGGTVTRADTSGQGAASSRGRNPVLGPTFRDSES